MNRRFLLLLFVCALPACVRTSPPAMSPVQSGACRPASLRWFAPQDSRHRARLDAWCAGVGAPAIHAIDVPNAAAPVDIRDVTFVSWNVHVGTGDLRAFVSDLRAGRLTRGRHVHHFVLMLQEAVRSTDVPPYSTSAAGARRIRAHDTTQDIVQVSRDLALAMIYVPSMRNANSPSDPAADRGSAILSTLPLEDPIALELPGERQRRVAILAALGHVSSGGGQRWSVGAIHLDALGSTRRLWLFWTPWMREAQVRAMASLLPSGPLVLGADLNTWHGKDERAARFLTRLFQDTRVSLERHGLGLRVLDYLFFRTTDRKGARYEETSRSYGSDHYPLIGWVE